jgi:hypothetical protein
VTSLSRFPAFVGGFGSGKTAAAMGRAMRLKIQCREQDIAYYLPTYTLIEDIAMQRFPELCERKGWAYKLRAGPNAADRVPRRRPHPVPQHGAAAAHRRLRGRA